MKFWLFSRREVWLWLLGISVLVLSILAGVWLLASEKDKTTSFVAQAVKEVPIYFVEKEEPVLALSFDAAWGCERTEKILAVLKEYNVQATFFLTNIWLEDYPEMAQKIAADGHEIAMHSVTHPHMNSLSQAEVLEELAGNQKMITEITGYQPKLFRFPFGEYNNQNVILVREQGYAPIQWSIDSLDWKEMLSKDDIVRRVTDNLHNGAIILCHNNGQWTAEAIAEIIPYALEKGYSFLPIGKLIYPDISAVDQQGRQMPPF
ncbi:MAG: polysaccharide deacetylase family protein [Peptococcaceae bacterium]|nr:polysaccharide deacetylase family protein [Peptococcaceae bacterium]